MKKISILFSLFSCWLGTSLAQTPTWAGNVASIMYNRCTSCHHPGAIAPFSLMTYADASGLAFDIQDAVNTKTMPPWPPDPTYKPLAHERVLSASEIQTINDWVQGGVPAGNLQNAPTPPTYSNQPTIANADLVSTMPSYTSTATTSDMYRCFVIPSGLSAVNYITGMEVIPGNAEIVHHVLVYQDSTPLPAQLDAQDPGPGYTSFGGTGSNNSKLIGAWVPGQKPVFYPMGMGVRLAPNTNIILQVHYPKGSSGQTDATQARMKLTTSPSRPLFIAPIINHGPNLLNGPLFIPANTVKSFASQYNLPAVNLSILNISPHMHLIGKSIKAYGVTPQNDTLPYINIPNWDFHWQGSYMFKTIQKIPASTKLRGEAVYDNTSNNPNNPHNPPQDVSLGEETDDEMMLVYFTYTLYFPGDENIVLEQNTNTDLWEEMGDLKIEVFPNPASDKLQLTLPQGITSGTLRLIDSKGSIVKSITLEQLLGKDAIDVSDLASGNYTLWLSSEQKSGYV
ncbi:MAG: T9SS type A sorting domain-containing protein, partial [Bacteroidia bacterium]